MEWSEIVGGTLYGVNAHRIINTDYTDTICLSFQIDDRIYHFTEVPGYMWSGEFTGGHPKKAWGEFEPVAVNVKQRSPSVDNIQDGVTIKHHGKTIISIGKHHGESVPCLLISDFEKLNYKRKSK